MPTSCAGARGGRDCDSIKSTVKKNFQLGKVFQFSSISFAASCVQKLANFWQNVRAKGREREEESGRGSQTFGTMCRLRWHVNGHAPGLGWKTFYCRICCRQVNALKCRHTRRCTRTWSTFLLAGPCPGFPATLNKEHVCPQTALPALPSPALLSIEWRGWPLQFVYCKLRNTQRMWKKLKTEKRKTFHI